MKISYSWLKNYIDIDLEPGEVSRMLTDCGLEVEDMQTVASVKGGLKGIVIGEVKECKQHPNADKLSVTKVDVGGDRLLDIVCGAPNVAEGQKVPVATEGTTLYNGDKEFTIKKTKLRGEASEGMICAEDELGLGPSHEGIMVLDPNAQTGTPAADYFNVKEDTVYEIGLTPNRADATSHIGTARDLVAVLNRQLFSENEPDKLHKQLIKPSVDDFKVDNHNRPFNVIIEDTEACPRYSGLTISGVEVKESPGWLKNYLLSIDVRPINNIVDISNFVLFETGQPLHIFNADKVKGDKVIIKKLPKGTKFTTLDEVERELTGNDLMICDEDEGMCIAGVFGGIHSGVTENTKNIFIESAYFEPTTIRKTSQYHGLKTDASFRFERGADPDNTVYALKRVALLIKEIAGGTISSEIIDEYPNPIHHSEVAIDFKRVDELIGQHIDPALIKIILRSLDIGIKEEADKGLRLSIPNSKVDVKREADVIEEILRIYGYNNVEFKEDIKSSVAYSEKPDRDKVRNIISDYLTGNGFYEIMTNSLTSHDNAEKIGRFDEKHDVRLLNPLSKELNVMRQSLLFGAINSVVYNLNRQQPDLKFYEF
ncbi:MAG: phenylalanine--tRNA ligase subunit beta, partial [Bacteroidales bacterium]|nr:phenylalanine--tRNA ligase subunit beta [Bacteroidales bacterium]